MSEIDQPKVQSELGQDTQTSKFYHQVKINDLSIEATIYQWRQAKFDTFLHGLRYEVCHITIVEGPSQIHIFQLRFLGSGGVRTFLFYLESVYMRGKNEEDKALQLLNFIDGRTFVFIVVVYETWEIKDEWSNFPVVKKAFIEEFEETEAQQEVIIKSIVATLDTSN